MSISISQTDNVGLTVESDPLALKKASNLSDLTSTTTARTNLGLGAVATALFATNVQTVVGASTTLATNPANIAAGVMAINMVAFSNFAVAGATSGAGASYAIVASAITTTGPTSVVGYSNGTTYYPGLFRGTNRGSASWLWNKRFEAQFRLALATSPTDSNAVGRVQFGGTGATGDLTVCGVSIKVNGNGNISLQVHNGTTLTNVTGTESRPASPNYTDIIITSDGAGNVQLYQDDVLSATTALGPTSVSSTAGACYFKIESDNIAIITGASHTLCMQGLKIRFS